MSKRPFSSISSNGQQNALKGWLPMKYARCFYSWRLKNFSSCAKQVGECLTSPMFSGESKITWRLHIYPNGLSKIDREFISLNLELCTSVTKSIFAKCEILLLDWNLAEFKNHESCVTEFGLHQSRRVFERINRSELLSGEHGILPTDELNVVIIISAVVRENDVRNPEIEMPLTEKAEPSTAVSVASLLETEKHSDVTLNVGEREFLVHKVILASMSAVFLRMFEDKITDITDFDGDTIGALLHFIYTGKTPQLNAKLVKDLLAASETYQIDSLKAVLTTTLP